MRRSERRRQGGGWLDYLVTLVVALVIAILVKTFLVQPFFIPSSSMVPTLETNDKILVSKLTPGVFDLERGDAEGPLGPGRPAHGVLADGRRVVIAAGPIGHLPSRGVGDGSRLALRGGRRGRSVGALLLGGGLGEGRRGVS